VNRSWLPKSCKIGKIGPCTIVPQAAEGFRLSKAEAAASFGDDRIFIERFVDQVMIRWTGLAPTPHLNPNTSEP